MACGCCAEEPGFAATMVLTLARAIGATTTIFSIVDAVLLPPPFPEPHRISTGIEQPGGVVRDEQAIEPRPGGRWIF